METISQINNDMGDLKIKFDGQTHQIEANTLINSFLHFTSIVQEINTELNTGKKIDIKINALPEGSFLIHLTIESLTLLEQAQKLFSSPTSSAVANIITELGGIYGLYRWLGGKLPKRQKKVEGKVTLENSKGDTITISETTINIYNNKVVQKSLNQGFATLENDINVTGFEILDENDTQLVIIERDLFADLSNGFENSTTETEKILTKNAILNIVRLSFDKTQKWEFYYEGNKITAKIDDIDFQIKIDKGEAFAKGDTLEVELAILQEFDQTVNTFINKSYKINKIITHIPRPKQVDLF